MKKKKVLFLNSSFFPSLGGVENSLRSLSEALIRENYRVYIVTGNRANTKRNPLPHCERLFGAKVFRYEAKGFLRRIISCYLLCRRLKNKNEFEEVISRSVVTTLCAKLARFRNVKYLAPAVYKEQSSPERKNTKLFVYVINCLLEWLVLKSLNVVYVFSNNMESQLKNVKSSLIVKRVFPGVDLERFRPLGNKERYICRENAGISEDEKLLICLGRLELVKGFDIAIEALSILPKNYKLWIIGGGSERNSLESLSEELDVKDRVTFHEFTEEPEKFYKIADAFMATSRYEPLGQVILEAAASGLPIIAFRSGNGIVTATEEIYERTGADITFTKNASSEALSNAVECRLNSRGVETSLQHSSPADIPTWISLYESLRK